MRRQLRSENKGSRGQQGGALHATRGNVAQEPLSGLIGTRDRGFLLGLPLCKDLPVVALAGQYDIHAVRLHCHVSAAGSPPLLLGHQ